jgi:hypothetical protein
MTASIRKRWEGVKRRSRWGRIRKRRSNWGVVRDTIALKLTDNYTAVEVPVRPFGKGTLQTKRSTGKWKR